MPFVQLSGSVGMLDGFDALPSGSTVIVTATKYRRNGSLELESFVEDSYGYQVFEWPDLTVRSSVNWSFVVPADTLVYLWAYADHDGNGLVNEVGEAVAAGGGDPNGRLQTGESNSSHNLTLAAFEEPPGPPPAGGGR